MGANRVKDIRKSGGNKLTEGFSLSGYERDLVALNLGGVRFLDISGVSGADSVTDGRAAVYADFDNDGDADIFLRTAFRGPGHLLYRNRVGQDLGFLRLALRGGKSGRDAFGAIVRVKTSQGTLTQVKAGGSGFLSQHDPRLLFGLGQDAGAQSIEVRWPSGLVQRFAGLAAGSSVLLIEGEAEPKPVAEKRFRLPDPASDEQRRFAAVVLKPGDALPDVPIQPNSGTHGDRPSTLAALAEPGRLTIVNFWATWCESCKTEMPELEKISQAGRARVVGVSVDEASKSGAIAAYVKKVGARYPIYVADPKALKAVFRGDDMVVPLSLVVDEGGKVRDVLAGWTVQAQRRLADILAAAPAPPAAR